MRLSKPKHEFTAAEVKELCDGLTVFLKKGLGISSVNPEDYDYACEAGVNCSFQGHHFCPRVKANKLEIKRKLKEEGDGDSHRHGHCHGH